MAALYAKDSRASEVEVISGSCMLLKREVFDAVGGFSESYFMYGEDLDLCYRIKQSGLRVYYVPETSIVHHGGGSTKTTVSNFSNVMMRESVFRFMRSHRGAFSATLYRAAIGATSLLRMTLILPLLAVSGRHVVRHGKGSLQKWKAILRWSCGLESWVRHSPCRPTAIGNSL
jgi:GT2 family glycosyltransferase